MATIRLLLTVERSFPLCSTPAGFARLRFNALRRASLTRLKRSQNLEATFCSPARTVLLPVGPYGVKAPDLLLQLRDADSANPVRLFLPPRYVSSTTGELNGKNPLSAASTPLPWPLHHRHSPLGLLTPRDRCTGQVRPKKTYLSKRPISFRSPPAGLLNVVSACGSSFLVRYVLFGSLFR